ncbi:MAG: cobalamin-binding protein [Hamadaea sp.]|nr:cobalamin-binding protein [Hamadaea sp.]NUT24057.1 cobalamin-binding protein [Hamadaea sp.]
MPRTPRRVVSLVPSLTEAVAVTVPGILAGATDYCTHPAGLDVPRIGGSKYPDVERILDLRPDLVLANVEENRKEDVDQLAAAGVQVWTTYPRDLDAAFASLTRLLAALGADRPTWLADAEVAWTAPTPDRRVTAVIPVWRKPWIVLGGGTFAGDLLRRLGIVNVFGDDPGRYPRPSLETIRKREPELVILPDEPYSFTADDGPEYFAPTESVLISGRHLTWYGPSLAEARTLLAESLTKRSGRRPS